MGGFYIVLHCIVLFCCILWLHFKLKGWKQMGEMRSLSALSFRGGDLISNGLLTLPNKKPSLLIVLSCMAMYFIALADIVLLCIVLPSGSRLTLCNKKPSTVFCLVYCILLYWQLTLCKKKPLPPPAKHCTSFISAKPNI